MRHVSHDLGRYLMVVAGPRILARRRAMMNNGASAAADASVTRARQSALLARPSGLTPSLATWCRADAIATRDLSELRQPGKRRQDPYLMRAEFDDHRVVILDQDDPAEAVLVVGHLIANGELLNGRGCGQGVEGTSGQETPGRGAGRLHFYQYAPCQPRRPFPPVRMPVVSDSRTGFCHGPFGRMEPWNGRNEMRGAASPPAFLVLGYRGRAFLREAVANAQLSPGTSAGMQAA
jgi:hypothetical protein